MPNDNNKINVEVWASQGQDYQFAEQHTDLLARTANTGICFSGGGTRALSATMGQLRGLTHLGLIDNVRYISCVSGGAWASVPYTYYKSGSSNDEQFLGSVTHPEDLTMKGLDQLDEKCLGHCANQGFVEGILRAMMRGLPAHRWWTEMIGDLMLQPFGLHDYQNPAYFSLNQETINDIKHRNPILSNAEFHTVRHNRPYLIINSCLIGPENLLPLIKLDLIGFEYTPLYFGSPLAKHITYQPELANITSKWVGGGFVEPFAAGSSADTGPLIENEHIVTVNRAERPFTLADAAGTSSTAFASTFAKLPILRKIGIPEETYWPVTHINGQEAEAFSFGDGGNIENYGLIPLLQRQVETIVVFINTETKLNLDYDPTTPPSDEDIDYSLGPLFGYPAKDMKYNQVFDQDSFVRLIHDLQQAKQEGRTVMATTNLTVQANSWWGVEGDWQVKICWLYNDRVKNWEEKLPEGIREAIEHGNERSRALDETSQYEQSPLLHEMNSDEIDQFMIRQEQEWKELEENHTSLLSTYDTEEKDDLENTSRDLGLSFFHGHPFNNFPNYNTISQNPPKQIRLTNQQINLLADLSCWNITENADLFEQLLT